MKAQTPEAQCDVVTPAQEDVVGVATSGTPLVEAILEDTQKKPCEPALTRSWLLRAEDCVSDELMEDEFVGDDFGEEVVYTQEKVDLLRLATQVFFTRLNKKLAKNGIPTFDLEDPDEDMTLDLLGEEVTVQWKEYGRCGDVDYFTKSMPFSELVDDEQEAA